MPLQNRVTPTGEIVADPARGLLMGNRGILHDATRQLGGARWRHRRWIACRLAFRGRRRLPMSPGAYTELFFLDEAVALAAGHRPCAECRRLDYEGFRRAWTAAAGGETPGAEALDAMLHRARVEPGTRRQRRHVAMLEALPDGTFVMWRGGPALVLGPLLLPWQGAGYGDPEPRPAGGAVTVLTPLPTVAALAAGYRPSLHPSALANGPVTRYGADIPVPSR